MKILHLTLTKHWFDQIALGIKKIEFREIKDYWTKRLFDADGYPIEFDEIHIKNGYASSCPFMIVKHDFSARAIHLKTNWEVYCIGIGDILQIENWDRESVMAVS